jgi:N-acetylmuramic acid 6-phosphate etherase
MLASGVALTLESFLAEASQFRLGGLMTERAHPKTAGLAELAGRDLPRAIAAFAEVDRDAIAALREHAGAIDELAAETAACLDAGGRVYLCGCGATGRLAMALEYLWRSLHPDRADRVIGFMAGGDAALVRSVEGFEDYPEFGARHLDELGFTPADLLLAVTEGGETSYVIGAAARAAQVARRRPWLLYCNPDELLRPIERSRRIIEDAGVRSFSMPVGPMALTGSTRLQATTAQTLAAGLALFGAGGGGARDALDRSTSAGWRRSSSWRRTRTGPASWSTTTPRGTPSRYWPTPPSGPRPSTCGRSRTRPRSARCCRPATWWSTAPATGPRRGAACSAARRARSSGRSTPA